MVTALAAFDRSRCCGHGHPTIRQPNMPHFAADPVLFFEDVMCHCAWGQNLVALLSSGTERCGNPASPRGEPADSWVATG